MIAESIVPTRMGLYLTHFPEAAFDGGCTVSGFEERGSIADMSRKHVIIYTDGSCETQTGDGGWGFLLVFGDVRRRASGFEPATTNNRMELTGAVRALEALSEPCKVTLVTDSQYLKKAFTDGWLKSWQRNGWRTASKQPVKNKDLWLRLLELTGVHEVSWQWTRGHAGHTENEAVDDLALAARRSRQGLDETYRSEN